MEIEKTLPAEKAWWSSFDDDMTGMNPAQAMAEYTYS